MIQVLPWAAYQAMFLLFSGELIFILLKKVRIAEVFSILGVLVCFAGLIHILLIAERLPLFGAFEASFYIVFVLALLKKISRGKVIPLVFPIIILLILAFQMGKPIVLNDDYYMYDNIWVMLFFNLRLLAAAFFVHAMALYISCSKSARLYQLGGIFIYLVSEWAGSIWCLNWFGESWLWSHGFFKASIVFLLVMLACHMPSVLENNKLFRTIIGSLPACFILWMIFFH